MWTYRQKTGELLDNAGHVIAIGYSGHEEGLNNPEMQDHKSVGPIPQGMWVMTEMYPSYPPHGPFVIRLEAMPDTETFGRSGFLVHGDLLEHPGEFQASLGCIVLGRHTRETVWNSGDRSLVVVAGDQPQEVA